MLCVCKRAQALQGLNTCNECMSKSERCCVSNCYQPKKIHSAGNIDWLCSHHHFKYMKSPTGSVETWASQYVGA